MNPASSSGFVATRPAVARVLDTAMDMDGYWLVTYCGTAEALLAAGVASAEMLTLPPCGKHSGCDEFGDWYSCRRRAGGSLELTRWLGNDAAKGPYGKGRGWKALGPSVYAEVDDALERMRRPQESRR